MPTKKNSDETPEVVEEEITATVEETPEPVQEEAPKATPAPSSRSTQSQLTLKKVLAYHFQGRLLLLDASGDELYLADREAVKAATKSGVLKMDKADLSKVDAIALKRMKQEVPSLDHHIKICKEL